MRLDRPLDDLFATGSHVRVLRALTRLPQGMSVSGREIARRSGVSQPTTADALRSLEHQGLVLVGRRPRADYYRLNPDHVLTPAVAELFRSEERVPSELEEALADGLAKLGEITAAYLFGSAARGEMRPDSDIDVAVKSARELPEELAVFDALQRRFGNRVNVIRLRSRGARGVREAVEREGRRLPLRGLARKST